MLLLLFLVAPKATPGIAGGCLWRHQTQNKKDILSDVLFVWYALRDSNPRPSGP